MHLIDATKPPRSLPRDSDTLTFAWWVGSSLAKYTYPRLLSQKQYTMHRSFVRSFSLLIHKHYDPTDANCRPTSAVDREEVSEANDHGKLIDNEGEWPQRAQELRRTILEAKKLPSWLLTVSASKVLRLTT